MVDILRGGIVINEILAEPVPLGGGGFDTDGGGTARPDDEFVELLNTSSAAVDVSGLELWDPAIGLRFTVPDSTVLEPGARLLVITQVQTGGSLPIGGPDDLAFEADDPIPRLLSDGDNVVVYDPDSDTFIQAFFGSAPLDDPPTTYAGFSATATRVGTGEDFGTPQNGLSQQRFPDGGDLFFATREPSPLAQNLCFTPGTLIRAEQGEIPVEALECGMRVWTQDDGLQRLRWIGRSPQTAGALAAKPALRPIRVRAGALGPGRPARDMMLSPQHRVLVRGPIARRMCGNDEVLVPIKELTLLKGIAPVPCPDGVDYIHLMFDRHQVIMAEGALVESLYAGPHALQSIHKQGLDEIYALFPELRPGVAEGPPPAVRPLLQNRQSRELVRRHRKNRKPIYWEGAF